MSSFQGEIAYDEGNDCFVISAPDHSFAAPGVYQWYGEIQEQNQISLWGDGQIFVYDAQGEGVSTQVNQEITLPVAQFTPQDYFLADPNIYGATIDWGDGSDPVEGVLSSDGNGNYTVTGTHTYQSAGSYTVTTYTGVAGGTIVTTSTATVETLPVVVFSATPTANPVIGPTVSLSVLGDDLLGESNLSYTWSVAENAPGSVTFIDNATNSAKYTTAEFTTPGDYTFIVTITNAAGLSVTSSVNVTVATISDHVTLEEGVDLSQIIFGQGTYLVPENVTVQVSGDFNLNGATFINEGHIVWHGGAVDGCIINRGSIHWRDPQSQHLQNIQMDFGSTLILEQNGLLPENYTVSYDNTIVIASGVSLTSTITNYGVTRWRNSIFDDPQLRLVTNLGTVIFDLSPDLNATIDSYGYPKEGFDLSLTASLASLPPS